MNVGVVRKAIEILRIHADDASALEVALELEREIERDMSRSIVLDRSVGGSYVVRKV